MKPINPVYFLTLGLSQNWFIHLFLKISKVPSPFYNGNRAFSAGLKVPELEANRTLPSRDEDKNMWPYTRNTRIL